jgi:hypothetical protein
MAIQTNKGDTEGVAMSLMGIGMIHQQRREYDAALEQYLKALAIERDYEIKLVSPVQCIRSARHTKRAASMK